MIGVNEMRYLVVVAHPDDEVLGVGGTIFKLISEGNDVAVAIMSYHAAARSGLSDTLSEDQNEAMSLLGVKKVYSADFPNIKMNTVAHLDLVQFVERCIADFGADVLITHHPSDTNDDHCVTSRAVMAASRLFQRREGISPLRQLLFMEVPSSTEWSFDSSSNRFSPNFFVEIGEEGIDRKIVALHKYKGVMRPYPHPRSEEALKGLAAFRGSQAGCNYAEAFECVFNRA